MKLQVVIRDALHEEVSLYVRVLVTRRIPNHLTYDDLGHFTDHEDVLASSYRLAHMTDGVLYYVVYKSCSDKKQFVIQTVENCHRAYMNKHINENRFNV